MAKDANREQRLAEALRANLRRRKEQARGITAPQPAEQSSPPAGEPGPD